MGARAVQYSGDSGMTLPPQEREELRANSLPSADLLVAEYEEKLDAAYPGAGFRDVRITFANWLIAEGIIQP